MGSGGKAGEKPKSPKWIIDTHGLRDALTTPQNSVRVAVIGAIECGDMWLLKPVSEELREAYEDLYAELQGFSYKKYAAITLQVQAKSQVLMEMYGASFFGSIPSRSHFEAVATAQHVGGVLVSSSKALKHCKAIAAKCKLKPNTVIDIQSFALLQ